MVSKETSTQRGDPEKMKILEDEAREAGQWRFLRREAPTDIG